MFSIMYCMTPSCLPSSHRQPYSTVHCRWPGSSGRRCSCLEQSASTVNTSPSHLLWVSFGPILKSEKRLICSPSRILTLSLYNARATSHLCKCNSSFFIVINNCAIVIVVTVFICTCSSSPLLICYSAIRLLICKCAIKLVIVCFWH